MKAAFFLGFLLAAGAASYSFPLRASEQLAAVEPQCPPGPAWERNGTVPIPESFTADFPTGTQDRTFEKLQPVFDRSKGNINQIYLRALRENPCLRGVLHFAIALNTEGLVAGLQIIRSTTGDAAFDQKIADRISKIPFGRANGSGFHVFTYPILFTAPP
ncbi:MAG: AgmX/PglI C-terminal domain-containing protein [Stagnimonas sp.]|nr:AgmX/PglI C-terminal domain-containing protein [Stagnimonas sp.]